MTDFPLKDWRPQGDSNPRHKESEPVKSTGFRLEKARWEVVGKYAAALFLLALLLLISACVGSAHAAPALQTWEKLTGQHVIEFAPKEEKKEEIATSPDDGRGWTKTDVALQVAYTALHLMDWAQTLHMARDPLYSENNVGICTGRHPKKSRVNLCLGGSLALQTWLTDIIPHETRIFNTTIPARNLWQGSWIIIEGDAVNHNRSIGLGISLRM